MTTTNKQLIKYLKTLPPETEIEVVVAQDAGYGGIRAIFEPLRVDVNTEYINMAGNRFTKRDNKILYLGDN